MKTLQELIQQEQERGRQIIYRETGELHSLLVELINKAIAEAMTTTAKAVGELVPEEDITEDASEYERADRIAWNACRAKILSDLKTFLGEVN